MASGSQNLKVKIRLGWSSFSHIFPTKTAILVHPLRDKGNCCSSCVCLRRSAVAFSSSLLGEFCSLEWPFGGLYHIFHLQWIIMDLSNFWDVSIHFGWEGLSFVMRPSRRSKFLICALTGCRARISREFTPVLGVFWSMSGPNSSQRHHRWSFRVIWIEAKSSCHDVMMTFLETNPSNLCLKPYNPIFCELSPPHFDASSWACGIMFIHFPLAPLQPCRLHIPGGFGHLWKVIFSF